MCFVAKEWPIRITRISSEGHFVNGQEWLVQEKRCEVNHVFLSISSLNAKKLLFCPAV